MMQISVLGGGVVGPYPEPVSNPKQVLFSFCMIQAQVATAHMLGAIPGKPRSAKSQATILQSRLQFIERSP